MKVLRPYLGQVVLGLFIGFACQIGLFPRTARSDTSTLQLDCDIVIAEASLGGVAAAIQALRLGSKVCMSSMTDWVGGQLTNQGVPIDEPYSWGLADRQFLSRYGHKVGGAWIVRHEGQISGGVYSDYPHIDEVEKSMSPLLDRVKSSLAPCWVSTHCFPPSEGNRALRDILSPWERSGQLVLLLETVPKRVVMDHGRIKSVDFVQRSYTHSGTEPYSTNLSTEFEDWYSEHDSERFHKRTLSLKAPIFIDGTETGELIVLSGARYRLGFEGSATERPESECVMGFNIPVNLEARPPTSLEKQRIGPVGIPPGGLDFDILSHGQFRFWPDDSRPASSGLAVFDYRRLSNGSGAATAMNWGDQGNDYMSKNLIVPMSELGSQLTDWKGGIRVGVLAEAERRSYSFVAWLNDQAAVTWHGRGVTPVFDLHSPSNYFGTGTGLSKFPYLRESRRMEGYGGFFVQPEQITTPSASLGSFPDRQYTNFSDSIGIGSYPLDTRDCPTGRRISYRVHHTNHYQIPLRALISANVPNLMSANKTLAVAQIVNAAYRLHPTEWNAGFGAGTAASVAVRHHVDLHALVSEPALVREVQKEVVAAGGRVLWFSDQIPATASQ